PRYKSKKGWYKDKPPKEKGGMPIEVEIAGPIVIENKFIDPKTNTEKVIITDEDQKVIVESSDILTTQKLPSLMKYGFSINEKYTKDLGYALQQMRNQLPISYLYEGVGILETPFGPIVSLSEIYTTTEFDNKSPSDAIC
ncbi:DUF927 domain-containing protein, partial [Staphylococcus epidermidis]